MTNHVWITKTYLNTEIWKPITAVIKRKKELFKSFLFKNVVKKWLLYFRAHSCCAQLVIKRPVFVWTVTKSFTLCSQRFTLHRLTVRAPTKTIFPSGSVAILDHLSVPSPQVSQKHFNTRNTREHRLKVRACSKDQLSKTRSNAIKTAYW